jgi:hypothetical protein
MSKVSIKLNLPGINQVMKSEGIRSALKSAANAVANAAGEGAVADEVWDINYISIVHVEAKDAKAAREMIEDNTLIKAIGAVGLPMTKGGQ